MRVSFVLAVDTLQSVMVGSIHLAGQSARSVSYCYHTTLGLLSKRVHVQICQKKPRTVGYPE